MRPFPDVVRELAGGTVLDEATQELSRLVAAVISTRKAGSMTLKIDVKPNGEISVKATGAVTAKVPKGEVGETIFFAKVNEDGEATLTRDDPRQIKMELRRVGGDEDAAPRKVEEAVG